ncbi:MAG: NAD-dependent epimerase/dehydratase family protein [Terriglobia bacterium]
MRMELINSVEELEERLAAPGARDVESVRRIGGDIAVLGAGGKMGPSLARRIRGAATQAGVPLRVVAVSRFSSGDAARELQESGVETIACDLLNRDAVEKLPLCPNVLFLSGRKFGSTDRPDLTWAANTLVPAYVAHHYRASRIVAFSTGNIYPMVEPGSGGSVEGDTAAPAGEYAQSCLGRERVFEYFSEKYGTPCLLFRLNYAVDLRYGVLVDIARRVYAGEPVDLTVPALNAIWQGNANSYALRALEHATTPPRALNVTGPEMISVRRAAEYFAGRFGREAHFCGSPGDRALLSNASLCHSLLGYPEVSLGELMEQVAHWVARGGESLNKPTKFEVADGRF